MNTQEFFDKYGSKTEPQDYDWKYGGECVDLIKFYMHDVFGMNPWAIGNANQLWHDKYGILKTFCERIKGSKDLRKGDIIFIDTSSEFDHVGIYVENVAWRVRIFDQVGNGTPVGGELPPKYREYPIKSVLGVWRPNKVETEEQKRVREFADKHNIKGRSTTQPFTQFEMLLILSKINA